MIAEYHDGAGAGTPDGSTLEEEVSAGGSFAGIVTQTSPKVAASLHRTHTSSTRGRDRFPVRTV